MSNLNGKVRVCSLFSGVGGFELGVINAIGERADFVAYSEIDKYAIKVYERHFGNESIRCLQSQGDEVEQAGDNGTNKLQQRQLPNNRGGHKNYGDITNINPKELPDFDLLVGGFPCQAFSVAGKRLGFDDTRGTLFFDIARILKEKQPKHLVLENVKGLLSHDSGRTFTTILGVLSDLGYFVEWQVLNAKDFGVPQNRERVFIVGHLGNECSRQVFPISGNDRQTIESGLATVSAVTGVKRVELSPTLDTMYKKGLGSKQARPAVIHQLNQPTHSNDRVYADDGLSPTLNTAQGGNRQPFIAALRGRGVPPKQVLEPQAEDKTNTITSVTKDNLVGIDFVVKSDKKDFRTFSDKGIAPALQARNDTHKLHNARIRRLTPTECERLQGFPDDWTKYGVGEEPISDTQRYKMCGNAVTTNVVEAVIRNMTCLV